MHRHRLNSDKIYRIKTQSKKVGQCKMA